MSVIIKGVTMPGTCVDCPLFRESAYGFDLCKGKGIGFVAEDAKWLDATRPDWCPLVELPDKHGRLGDLDEVKTAFPCGESVRTECVRATIDNMPTIVESEGDD